ncbi:LytTR family DNA-binding domain-containing protein [Algoriphagus sp. A40]|uniref:LytR/AlgR family response regulator transcription factor n=1 Tax=Algoriphagus sp. A40 TaxID=1945863 RepID=UPI000987D513|nr:LytTR family DNA-binding domain-containing protein [Algoriphagus sp. A40]OOG72295.1 hypothetical protein B0E43_15450 [Algoriphagus sp. A40]
MSVSTFLGLKPISPKVYHFLFWLVITVIYLYDRRYLIQKFNLPEHFAACVTVRLLLIVSLVYFHLYYLVPKFFKLKKFGTYSLLLIGSLLVYVSLQNLYDIYLYGYVIGDVTSRDFWSAFPYNFITTSWYLVLTTGLKFGLDRYEEKRVKVEEFIPVPVPENGQDNVVFLKTGTKQIRTDLDEVTHIKGLKDYSIVYTLHEQIIVKGSLKSTENLLRDKKLIRVHKSYLVALDRIKTIQDNQIILGNHAIPIGRSYKKELYKLLIPS